MTKKQPTGLKPDHISVCICTYKRPEMLAKAIDGVLSQIAESSFTWELVIIDNDSERSAERLVHPYQSDSPLRINYACEPEKNIAMARNLAIQKATGNLIVFMDDDEYPTRDWLNQLYNSFKKFDVSGVLGPVVPQFPENAPAWLKKADVFDRRRFATGTKLSVRDTRTGNVLLDRNTFPDKETCFDPAFGLTGGEDVDFFERQINRNQTYVWCDEAIVWETVPPERWTIGFHFRKYFRIGATNGKHLRNNGLQGFLIILKRIASAIVWSLSTIIFLPFGRHFWIKPAFKLTYSVACILTYCGFSYSRNRD